MAEEGLECSNDSNGESLLAQVAATTHNCAYATDSDSGMSTVYSAQMPTETCPASPDTNKTCFRPNQDETLSSSEYADDSDGDPLYSPSTDDSSSDADCSGAEEDFSRELSVMPVVGCGASSAIVPAPTPAATGPAAVGEEASCSNIPTACKIQGIMFDKNKVVKTGTRTVPKPQDHYCLFCNKPQSRLSRHLETIHKEEKALLPYFHAHGKKEKKQELAKIRHAGDHKHNVSVLTSQEGTLVLKRRKAKDVDISNFLPCPDCLGTYQKKDLYRHKCANKTDGPRRQLTKRGQLLLPTAQKDDSKDFQEFLHSLRRDQISLTVKTDRLLAELARSQVKRHGFDKDRFGHIRNKVREMARLLLVLRQVTGQENGSLEDFLKPSEFRSVIKAVKQVAGYSEDAYAFKTPTLAQKLGHSLMTCAEYLEADAIESSDDVQLENARGYMNLHKKRWNEEVSAHASRTLSHMKKMKGAKRIPLTRDVAALGAHLRQASDEAVKKLCSQGSDHGKDVKEAWVNLAEATLTQIILFNRRRAGEASKLKLEDLKQKPSHDIDADVFNTLSPFEKKLCTQLVKLDIFGKRGRIVPVLLNAQVKAAIDLLVEKREAAGVSPLNNFVFACPHFQSQGHLRGSDTLRKFTASAKLQEPQLITSTTLRKQVATLSQIINLKDNELDVLAQYMGHDVRIHREVYRLPNDTMQLAKVSKMLLALEKGTLQKHQHSSLDDMVISENEGVTSDDDTECPKDEAVSQHYPDRSRSQPYSPRSCAQTASLCASDDASEQESDESWEFQAVGTTTTTSSLTQDQLAESRSQDQQPLMSSGSRRCRQKWSAAEGEAVKKYLMKYMLTDALPGKNEIIKCMLSESALAGRTWRHVKNYIRNHQVSRQRSKQRRDISGTVHC